MTKWIGALCLLALSAAAYGQAAPLRYPTKPVRLIAPFAPGGSVDILARSLAQKLSELWGQQVVVDNRAGAGGTVGTEMAAKAQPDGYTLLLVNVAHAVNPSLYRKLNFDPLNSFAPVSLLASVPNILMVNPAVPARNVGELIALAKNKPGTLNYASAGSGTSSHLAGELLKSLAHVTIVHVPYKGSAQAYIELLGGRVEMMFMGLVSGAQYLKSGRLRALAVTGRERSAAAPEVPTMIEAGVPGFEVTNWFGLLAPAGAPPQLLARLRADVVKALRAPDVSERFAAEGLQIIGSDAQSFADFVKVEIGKWSDVVRASGASVD
jgi:tripartite-type tricarboxylate transporter receptor subunit TctC